jgi:hypothetical protein
MARKTLNDLKPSSKLRQEAELIDADTIGLFYANPHDTTLAAALKIKTGTGRRKVYDVLWQNPKGLTDEEIMKMTGLHQNTERPRRYELVKHGFVVDSGRRRFTDTDSLAIVWALRNGK